MRDLRNEMYASATNENKDNSLVEEDFSNDTYVTKKEFNEIVKIFERKIALLESKIANLTGNGWNTK